jgi:hypothetical protein
MKFKYLANLISVFHIYELVACNMDTAHKIHHICVIATETAGVLCFSTSYSYKLGCLASIPLGTNVLSELRKSYSSLTVPYYYSYIVLKVSISILNYFLIYEWYNYFTTTEKICGIPLFSIHATQLFFCYKIGKRLTARSVMLTTLMSLVFARLLFSFR